MSGGTAELALAQKVIRNSHELYQALTSGQPLLVTAETAGFVQKLNSLQCGWAHAAVFSNRKDFTFARHVFKNTPEYKLTPMSRTVDGSILVPDSFDPTAMGW
jgi:hypothetical protein